MPRISANGVELNYDLTGAGETLVLVHGGWSDRNNWLPVVPELARSFRVVAYDRRSHGLSTRNVPGSRRDQEDDLAALIEGVSGEPAHVVGTSFGASIAIGLGSRRPELVRSIVAHEPPLISVAAGDPKLRVQLEAVQATVEAVVARVERGETRGAAEQFVEEIALGPGAWALLPQPLRETMVDSAPAFVAEQQDPAWADVELDELAAHRVPDADQRRGRKPRPGSPRSSPSWPTRSATPRPTPTAEPGTHLTSPTPATTSTTVMEFLSRVPARREIEAAVAAA